MKTRQYFSVYNSRGPNVSQIINRQFHLIKNSPFLHNIFPDCSVLVANKGCPNFKDSLVHGDPYNKKHDLTDIVPYEYKSCSKKCDSCDNFVESLTYLIFNASGRKYYIHLDRTCSTRNAVDMTYCKKCNK